MIGVILAAAIFIAVGALAVFKGQKLFTLFLSIFAFGVTFEFLLSTYGHTPTTIAIALAAAVVAVLLAQYAQKVAFFLLGFIVGCIIGILVAPLIPNVQGNMFYVVAVVVGVIVGILTAHWDKLFIRVGTSVAGGRTLTLGLLFLIFNGTNLQSFDGGSIMNSMTNTVDAMCGTFSSSYSTYILIGTIIFTIIGVIFQGKKH